jgi:GT2 family glycosyltransferase
MSHSDGVAVCIVTHDSADDLPGCLEAVAALDPPPLEVVIVDCASSDGSAEVAEREAARVGLGPGEATQPPGQVEAPQSLGPEETAQPASGQARRFGDHYDVPPMKVTVERSESNLGFAGGMNRAIALSTAPFVLSLNADARPEPDYCRRLLAACADDRHRIGAVTGRLLRFPDPDEPQRIDACGMRLTLTWRHLDRESGAVDKGQLAEPERVFGATGAATLFRREALLDAAIDGEVFAPEFHSFREDAELCFRLRERRWEIVYEPRARALHRRFNLPSNRRSMPAAVNLHSLKNRYLLRAYHQTARNLLLTLAPTLWRDLLALGHVLLRERTSLEAYRWLWRHRSEIRERRRKIRERRACAQNEIDCWFFTDGLPL